MRLAEATLRSIDPSRLGLELNYAVFKAELLHDLDGAINIAKAAFDAAISELDSIAEDSYKETTLIMTLLRDNIFMWQSQIEHDYWSVLTEP